MMPATSGALRGLRVIDLSRVLGGPWCGQALGDHGADVLKIEPPDGDETRYWGPPFQDGVAAYYIGLNRNKRVCRLDLSGAEGQQALCALLSDADVLIENFKTGTLEKWGLGEDVLSQRFPRLIHCRISGFGASGPLGGRVGYDAAIQALCGIMSINGLPEGEPLRVGIPVVDICTGMNALSGILLALCERQHSGMGQFVECSLFDTGISLLHPYTANWFASQQQPVRTGNAHASLYPYDVFPTATVPVFIGVGNNRQFAQLCACIDDPSLSRDPRFEQPAQRSLNRGLLRERLLASLSPLSGEALAERLLKHGVPAAPLSDIPTALAHPQTRQRDMVIAIGDHYRGIASPIKLSRTPASYRLAPPLTVTPADSKEH